MGCWIDWAVGLPLVLGLSIFLKQLVMKPTSGGIAYCCFWALGVCEFACWSTIFWCFIVWGIASFSGKIVSHSNSFKVKRQLLLVDVWWLLGSVTAMDLETLQWKTMEAMKTPPIFNVWLYHMKPTCYSLRKNINRKLKWGRATLKKPFNWNFFCFFSLFILLGSLAGFTKNYKNGKSVFWAGNMEKMSIGTQLWEPKAYFSITKTRQLLGLYSIVHSSFHW